MAGIGLRLCRTHAQAERETEIPPNRVADDLGWKPVAGVAGQAGVVILFGCVTSPATASSQFDGAARTPVGKSLRQAHLTVPPRQISCVAPAIVRSPEADWA
jgi:hypothetical protein